MNLAIALLLAAAPTQAPSDNYSQAWDATSGLIRRVYWAASTRKEEMESRLAAAAPKARAAKSRGEFADAVNTMLAGFKDSHFVLHTPEDQGYFSLSGLLGGAEAAQSSMPHLGAWFERADSGWRVSMLLDGEAGQKAGLRRGDIVATVDGKAFSPVASLRPFVNRTVAFGVRRGDQALSLNIAVGEDAALSLFLRATRQSGRIIQRNGRRLAYFRLWTMASTDFRSAFHAFLLQGQGSRAEGLVLDLRDGFGGRPEGYADPLFVPDYSMEWINRGGSTTQQFGFGRPVVVLINGGTRSAKEVFADMLKSSKRATLVGARTAGALLGSTPIRVNPWSILLAPIVDAKVNGRRLERVGVEPDVAVPDEPGPTGTDQALEEGLRVLEARVKSQAAGSGL